MKILYITPQLPLPPISGGRIKTLSTIKALTSLGHDIVLFSLIENRQDLKYLQNLKKIGIKKNFTFYNREAGERSLKKKLIRAGKSLFSFKPYGVLRYFNKKMAKKVNEHLSSQKFDVFWVNFVYMAQYLPKTFNGLKVIESHDVESKLHKEASQKGGFLHLKPFHLFEWIKYSLYEKIIYRNFDLVFAISGKDKKLLQEITHQKNIYILPPAIDVKLKQNIKKEPNTLLFIGTLFWYPNKEGIIWFLKKVYPQVKKKIPTVKVCIIGKYLSDFKPIRLDEVKFLGFVKNIERYINKAQVFIVPITYGTGLKVKILKAFSCGIPVVSTYEGAEGLEVADGKELLLAKNEEEFAEKTIKLLGDKRLREKLIINGRRFIKDHYSEEKLRKAISRVNSLSTA